MTDTDVEEPRRCRWRSTATEPVLEADCELCQQAGCLFHRPDQQPCGCSVADRHESTRGHGHVTSGGYVVGSIAEGVQSMFRGDAGECTIRLVGGAGDSQEVDHVKTRGGRPAKAFEIRGHRYERFANRPGDDGVWVYDYAPSPGVPIARMRKMTDAMPEALKGTPPSAMRGFPTSSSEVRPAKPPFEIVEDLPGSMPPPITGPLPSGTRLPPGAEPVIHDMGGAQPVPDDPPEAGYRWVRHDCHGVGCGRCDNRGWFQAEIPKNERK